MRRGLLTAAKSPPNVQFVRDHTAGTSTASGTTVAATIATADVAAGNLLSAWVSFDNDTATTPTVSSIDKMAGETNNWVKVAEHDASVATADDAVRGERWVIRTTVAWTVSTAVTATLSAAKTSKTILLQELSGVTTTVRGTAGTATATGTANPVATTSGDALVAGDVLLGGASHEHNVVPSDYVNNLYGSWSTGLTATANTGTVGTSVSAITQYKIINTTGSQSYGPDTFADSGAAVVALVPA